MLQYVVQRSRSSIPIFRGTTWAQITVMPSHIGHLAEGFRQLVGALQQAH